MRYVIIPSSFLLGFLALWVSASIDFAIMCFLVPLIFSIGMIYDKLFN